MALSTVHFDETEKVFEEIEMLQINPINQHELNILETSKKDFISFRSFSKMCD